MQLKKALSNRRGLEQRSRNQNGLPNKPQRRDTRRDKQGRRESCPKCTILAFCTAKDTERHGRNRMSRSVWSACSLLPLWSRAVPSTAAASCTHSKRFATFVARRFPRSLRITSTIAVQSRTQFTLLKICHWRVIGPSAIPEPFFSVLIASPRSLCADLY